jgi:hypothetical protein
MPMPFLSPRSLELARTLVQMNTVSANSNLELIHFVRDELKRLGVTSRLSFNAGRTKANLFATLGEGKPDGIILSGHTDTVPWDGQDWSADPLSAQVQDGAPLWARLGRHEELHCDLPWRTPPSSWKAHPRLPCTWLSVMTGGGLLRREELIAT